MLKNNTLNFYSIGFPACPSKFELYSMRPSITECISTIQKLPKARTLIHDIENEDLRITISTFLPLDFGAFWDSDNRVLVNVSPERFKGAPIGTSYAYKSDANRFTLL